MKGLTAKDVQRFRFQVMGFDVTVDGHPEQIRAMRTMYGSDSPEPPEWVKKWHADIQQCLVDAMTTGTGYMQLPDFSEFQKTPVARALAGESLQEQQR